MGKKMNDADVKMNIEFHGVEELIPYAKNSKSHSPEQVELIAASIERFGWTNPCLIADGQIVAGHGRVMAAKKLGLKRVPCIDLSHLSIEDRRAYVIVDNRSAEKGASWDLDVLRDELVDLEELGYDLDSLGFDEADMAEMFGGLADIDAENDKDPDEAPALPAVAASVTGDVWVCGAHRVMCGSSLLADDWDRLMNGEGADVCWTDPPYNVDYESKLVGKIMNDNMGDSSFYQFLLDMYSAVFTVMKTGAPIYVAHADTEGANFRRAFLAAGFKLQSCLIWKKNALVMGRSDYQWIHEPILYGWKTGSAHRWYGGRKNTSVIDLGDSSPFVKMDDGRYQIKIGDAVLVVSADAIVEQRPSSLIYEPKPTRSGLHPTQKPVALVERMLRQSARAGDIVIDAFGGSGTTLLAADRLGMSARLMELDPKFVDVIVRRWQDYTGRRAVHAVTGEAFPDEGDDRIDAPVTTETNDVF